ncbi:hypothetical protein ACVWVY_000479 [Bradyrhizobium sp. URHC0002]
MRAERLSQRGNRNRSLPSQRALQHGTFLNSSLARTNLLQAHWQNVARMTGASYSLISGQKVARSWSRAEL